MNIKFALYALACAELRTIRAELIESTNEILVGMTGRG
jgi:hypothetical protein